MAVETCADALAVCIPLPFPSPPPNQQIPPPPQPPHTHTHTLTRHARARPPGSAQSTLSSPPTKPRPGSLTAAVGGDGLPEELVVHGLSGVVELGSGGAVVPGLEHNLRAGPGVALRGRPGSRQGLREQASHPPSQERGFPGPDSGCTSWSGPPPRHAKPGCAAAQAPSPAPPDPASRRPGTGSPGPCP